MRRSLVIYFNKSKPIELAEYVMSTTLLGLFFTVVLIIEKGSLRIARWRRYALLKKIAAFDHTEASLTSIILVVIVPVIIFSIKDATAIKLLLQTVLFLINWNITKIYIAVKSRKNPDRAVCHSRNEGLITKLVGIVTNRRAVYTFFIVLSFGQLSSLLYEPITGKPKFINEFLNIPEQTVLADDVVVDNTDFWNQHKQSMVTNKWDVTRANQLEDVTEDSGALVSEIFKDSDPCNVPESAALGEDKALNEFLSSNLYELQRQIHSRFMFHHQSFMYIPIGQMALGREWKEIPAQYGLGSAWLFEKVLNYMQNVSVDGWVKLSYSSFLIYLFLYCVIVYRITKDIRLTAIATVGAIALINYREYELLIMPPGDSPWRNVLDIVVLYCVYRFGENKKTGYFLIAILLAAASIVINPEMGLMIFTATILAGLFSLIQVNDITRFRSKVVTICVAGIAIAISALHLFSSNARLGKYYIDGVLGFPITNGELFTILSGIALMYVVLIYNYIKRPERNLIHIIWLFLYSQEIFLYVVWHFYHVGFYVRSYIYLLFFVMLAHYLNEANKQKLDKAFFLIWIGLLAFYIHSIALMSQDKNRFDAIFRTHKTYAWNLEKAKILSTMDPALFQNGIDLIKKYEGDHKGIYIVSEYDGLLPFLASQYSLMPFFDLKWYNVTDDEIQGSINLVRKEGPKYLFVDTAVNRQLDREVIDKGTPMVGNLNEESEWRIQRLRLLYSIFKSVEKDYVLKEKGDLISVYEKKYPEKKYRELN